MASDKNYVEQVAAHRPGRSTAGWTMLALLFLFIAYLFAIGAAEPIPIASKGYQIVVRAARISLAGWALFFAILGVFMFAKTARGIFGLPEAKRLGAKWFVTVRNVGTGFLLIVLLASSDEPMGNKPGGYSDTRMFVVICAAFVWLLFALDLVPLLIRASRSLGARISALRYKKSSVGGTETGAVRIEGRVASGGQNLSTGDSELVYYSGFDEEQNQERELVPFLLEMDGHRLFVDATPESTIVVPSGRTKNQLLRVGDEVEIWGEVVRPDQAYRGDSSRITAGNGRLLIFQGNRALNRRFILAASVELAAAAAFVAVGVLFAVFLLLPPTFP